MNIRLRQPRPSFALDSRKRTGRLAIACLFAFGCTGGDPTGVSVPTGTPVILISIDTLRSDRLPVYGYDQVETPAIDQLATDGIVYEQAFSAMPLTLPSHLSIFTGRNPGAHGVRDNDGYKIADYSDTSLQSRLKAAGYQTGGSVSSWVLRGVSGVSEGFDFWEDSLEFGTGLAGLGGLQRTGNETLKLAEPWLAPRLDSDDPFFFFFHLYEPHAPWEAPEPFRSRYESAYDGEVASADAIVGEFFDRLRQSDLYDRALIILTSDHGEGLWDHGEEEHGVLLYREAIQVPLIVKLPSSQHAGERVSAVARLIDIQPTILELLDLPQTPGAEGRSLLELLDPSAPPRLAYSETYYPRLHYGWHEQHSVVDGQYQYIEGPASELFDLLADPTETVNLVDTQGSLAAELSARLNEQVVALEAPNASDEETLAQLAALGYLGQSSASTEGPLPDPRPHLGLLDDLKDGFRFFRRQQYEEAVATYRKVLDQNPHMLDAWEQLTQSLQSLGRTDEALAAYEQALATTGAQSHLALAAAQLLFELDRLEDARQHALLARDANPVFAYELLAKIELADGNSDEALVLARQAVEKRGTRIEPLTTLAVVLAERNDYPAALAAVQQAEEAFAKKTKKTQVVLQGLHLVKGKVLASLQRYPDAETAFRREIELFPEQTESYAQLAVLYALTGRSGQETLNVLRGMVNQNDNAASYRKAVETLRLLGDTPGAESLLTFARGRFPGAAELTGL